MSRNWRDDCSNSPGHRQWAQNQVGTEMVGARATGMSNGGTPLQYRGSRDWSRKILTEKGRSKGGKDEGRLRRQRQKDL